MSLAACLFLAWSTCVSNSYLLLQTHQEDSISYLLSTTYLIFDATSYTFCLESRVSVFCANWLKSFYFCQLILENKVCKPPSISLAWHKEGWGWDSWIREASWWCARRTATYRLWHRARSYELYWGTVYVSVIWKIWAEMGIEGIFVLVLLKCRHLMFNLTGLYSIT